MFRKIAVGICVLVLGYAGISNSAILLDKVMAIVNKEVITWSDLYRAMEFEASAAVRAMNEKERRKVFKNNEGVFLESLIDMRLQIQEAAKEGVFANDEDIERAIKDIKSKYSMTDEMFNDAVKKEGFTLSEYRKKLSEQIIIGRIVDRDVRSKILVADAEVDKYIAEHKEVEKENEGFSVSHIFIKKSDNRVQTEEKAKDIYKRIIEGEDFSELAKRYSEDPSAKSGGDLGFIRKSDMSANFLKALSGMKTDDVSEPFWGEMGAHIIKLNEIRSIKSHQELRERVKQKLMDETFDKEYKSWLKGLRQKAFVEVKT